MDSGIMKKVERPAETDQGAPAPTHFLDTPRFETAPSTYQCADPSPGRPPTPRKPVTRVIVRTIGTTFLMVFSILAAACSGYGTDSQARGAISEDDFIQAYYRLRMEALRSPDMEIDLEARDSILEVMNLTAEDLLEFVELRGMDGQFMQGIWETVDSLLREDRIREIGPDTELEDPEETGLVRRGVGT